MELPYYPEWVEKGLYLSDLSKLFTTKAVLIPLPSEKRHEEISSMVKAQGLTKMEKDAI